MSEEKHPDREKRTFCIAYSGFRAAQNRRIAFTHNDYTTNTALIQP